MNWSGFKIKPLTIKALFNTCALRRARLKTLLLYLLFPGLTGTFMMCGQAENTGESPASVIRIENSISILEIEQQGGAMASFRLKNMEINPLNWSLSLEQMPANNRSGAVFKGHFLCVGRWGSPSSGEIRAGIPHNGEPSRDTWKVLPASGKGQAQMSIHAPLDGLSVERKVALDDEHPVFAVQETFTNQNTFGRISNVVQHVTLGPPFLSAETMIYSNAKEGFLQSASWPDPHTYAYIWPIAKDPVDQKIIDLQKSDYTGNYVSTHIFEDSIGWVVAHDPIHKLWFGYIWQTADYPWINIWHHTENGRPIAKGIEFGTTGIGRDYNELLSHDSRFYGRNSFEYMDAGEKISKKYLAFLVHDSDDDDGKVQEVQWIDGTIIITTANGRQVRMALSLSW